MAGRRKIEWIATAGHGSIKIMPKAGDTESSVYRAFQGQNYLAGIAKKFIDGIAEIQSRFKPEIQSEQITALANELLIQVQGNMAKFLSPIAVNFRSLQGDIYKLAVSPFNDSIAAIRRAEIRTHLRTLELKERINVFNQAVENGSDEVVQAFIENNQFFRLLDPGYIEQGKRKWLLRKDPTLAETYFSTEQAGSVVANDFENIIGDLAAYASPQPERVQNLLADIPRPGWQHEKTGDERMIDSGVMPSNLPLPSQKLGESAEARLAAANES
jgi:hypothetical protein